MGITIHYRLVRRETPGYLLREVEVHALKLGMEVTHRSWNHLMIHPAPHCESIDLNWHKWKNVKKSNGELGARNWSYEKATLAQFQQALSDEDWVCSSFTKTHYAGVKCHIAVAELLRFIAGRCRLADIHDEADYYERGGKVGIELAKTSFDQLNAMMGRLTEQLKTQFGAENVITAYDLTRERDEVTQ